MFYDILYRGCFKVSIRSYLRQQNFRPLYTMADQIPREAFLPVYSGFGLKNGQYIVRRKLGEGVYSATYLVEDVEKEYDPL